MNDKIINRIIRIGAFAMLAAVLVLLFPRYNNSLRYHYEVGKPWAYSTLRAEYDFPIYKTDEQLAKEQERMRSTFAPYFRYIPRVQRQVMVISLQDMEYIQENGYSRISIVQNSLAKTYPLADVYTPASAYKRFGYECAQNLTLDTAMTNSYLEKQLATISPTQGLVQAGEKIIGQGDIVTDRHYQILQSLRRTLEGDSFGQKQHTLSILGEAILVLLFLSMFVLYLYVFRPQYLRSTSTILFFCLQILIVIGLACCLLRFSSLSIYLIPFAWVPILTRVFFDSRTALFLHFTTILIASLIAPAPVEFFFIQITVGMVAVSSLSDMTRRAQLVQTAGWILLTQLIAYMAFSFAQTGVFSAIDPWMFLYFFICAILTIGCYGLIFVFERMFRFISSITLIELTDINSDLLHALAERAPGTFQHSMQVSNLASEAAKAVGANTLLVRTGALYHDIGKMTDPLYFTENQTGVENPLLKMDPRDAAQVIISHVSEGEKIARRNHLPEVIINFITTHHGTSLVRYFYNTWCNAHPDEPVDTRLFQYPGPKPSTKEGAILMMADAVEARSRSLSEYTEASISNAVDKMIDAQIADGQFADTPLSFKDVEDIRRVFKSRLIAFNHHRISYPTLNNGK
ncbi:MAG: HDIG domain-containing protein [Paludibacteraceae bacterium]|nr:HDIG domain-containing protein [Paludibacteraceae bacterium]